MTRKHPAEFRGQALPLVRCSQSVPVAASGLGVTASGLHGWLTRDRVDRGDSPGTMSPESRGFRKARRRIKELEGQA